MISSRVAVAVHVLAYMAWKRSEAVTSERIAASVNTNPVVIRRTLGQLRRAGLVTVQRGNGAGWSLARPLDAIPLLSVYQAVAPDEIFALHPSTPSQACPIGRGIQPVLRQVYGGVEQAVREELARTTVASVLDATLDTPTGKPRRAR